jgi:hypothetical protein
MQQDNVKPEHEIYEEASFEWLQVLVRMWDAIDKPVDIKRLENYERELSSVPMGLLKSAVSRCIRENTYTSVPSVGKVWEAIRKELGNPRDIDESIERWKSSRWERCIYRFGG